jgi:hypothetical protein
VNILTEKLKEFGMTDEDLSLVESAIQSRVDEAAEAKAEAKTAELLESERQTFTEQVDSIVESFAAKFDAYSKELLKSLEEKYRSAFEDEVQAIIENYETRLEQYSQYVITDLKENYKSQDDLKVSMAEALIESVRAIYGEYNVTLPESTDFVAEYKEFVSETENQIGKLEEENKKLKRQIIVKEKQSVLESIVSDMTVMQRENFESLCESVVFVSADQYRSRLQTLKDVFVGIKLDSSKVVESASTPKQPAQSTMTELTKVDASVYSKILGIK